MQAFLIKILLNLMKSWKRFYFDFSQFGEEKVIFNIIERISSKNKLNNYYVDFGGFDPIKFSNTFKLYQKNWSGVIVEPNRDKTKNWNKIRPKDYVINAAVVENENEEEKINVYYDKKNSAMETSYPSTDKKSLNFYQMNTIKFREVLTICENNFGQPSFLNIDIEGNEEKLLMELDKLKYIIPIICVEIFLKTKNENYSIFNYKDLPGVIFMEKIGYYLVNINGPSLIFCHKDYWIPYTKL